MTERMVREQMRCVECRLPLPESYKATARYCGDRCRKRAYYARNTARLAPTYVKYRRPPKPKTDESRRKELTRNRAWRAIKSGRLVPETCLFCDEPKVDAHHHDYSLPFDVTWLCRRHHRRVHESWSRWDGQGERPGG